MKPFTLRHSLMLASIFGLAASVSAVSSSAGNSEPIIVDTMAGCKYSSGTALLSFDPQYCGATAGDAAYVVLRKVVEFDTDSASTSVVVRCAADASGIYQFSRSASEFCRVRFLHTAYDADDKPIGETLARDVVFPLATAVGADETQVDGRTNSLQMCAAQALSSGTAVTLPFIYDPKWPAGGVPARFRLVQVRDSVNRQMEILSSTTNVLIESSMPTAGSYFYTLNPSLGGRYTFFCTFFDGDNKKIGETYSAGYYIKERFGITLIIK